MAQRSLPSLTIAVKSNDTLGFHASEAASSCPKEPLAAAVFAGLLLAAATDSISFAYETSLLTGGFRFDNGRTQFWLTLGFCNTLLVTTGAVLRLSDSLYIRLRQFIGDFCFIFFPV